MSSELLSEEIRSACAERDVPEFGWQTVYGWADSAMALEDALATIWAALDVDTKLSLESEFDVAALVARRVAEGLPICTNR